MSNITASYVIKNRLNEIQSEVADLDMRMNALREEMERLNQKREMRIMEYEMLDRYNERNAVKFTESGTVSRMRFEDCVIDAYNNIGRPCSIMELLTALEDYGYKFSYNNGYNKLTKMGALEKISRGYYQVIRNNF